MWTRLSLRVKITFLTVSAVAIASLSFVRFASTGLLNLMEKAAGQGAATAAEGLAGAVAGRWIEQSNADRVDDPNYNNLVNLTKKLLDAGYIRRVEVIRVIDRIEIEHILSLPEDNSADYAPPGSKETIGKGAPYLEHSVGYSGVRLEKPGAFIAGWAPVTDQGRIVGYIILIVDGNEVQRALNTINLALVVVLLTLVLLSGIVAYKFATSFEKSAVTDGLMGIYNHKYLKQRLEQEVAKAARYGQQTSLVLFDIDFFKRVNDTYGHATGDLVLKSLAKWVTETARNTDVVARYGGEEIAVILPHTGLAGAQEFAERLRLKISNQVVHDPGEDAKFRVTVSVGVAQWEKGLSMMDLIKRADAALYHSKNMGRNRVTIFQEEILPGESPVGAPAAQGKR